MIILYNNSINYKSFGETNALFFNIFITDHVKWYGDFARYELWIIDVLLKLNMVGDSQTLSLCSRARYCIKSFVGLKFVIKE